MSDHLKNVDGIRVAWCTVERHMREMASPVYVGAGRSRSWVRPTISSDGTERPSDLVDRNFTAPAPNGLWLADLTDVKTHSC